MHSGDSSDGKGSEQPSRKGKKLVRARSATAGAPTINPHQPVATTVASNTRDLQGLFTTNLLSLQLQLGTLLEDAGGSRAMTLLDSLAGLPTSLRNVAITAFMHTIQRLANENYEGRTAVSEKLLSAEEKALFEFEDGLYQDILKSLETPVDPVSNSFVTKSPGSEMKRPSAAGTRHEMPLTLLDGRTKKEGKLVIFPLARKNKNPQL